MQIRETGRAGGVKKLEMRAVKMKRKKKPPGFKRPTREKGERYGVGRPIKVGN